MQPDSLAADAAPTVEQVAYQLSATDWSLRAGVALVFFIFALEKLVGSSWVSLFAAIGFGQWFRYLTGAVQLAGSALLLIPATARLGALLIASTMVGAMAAHLFVLDTGIGGAIIPSALLPLVIAAGWKGRGQRAESAGLVLR
jgi:putative oxidoreductase